MLSFLNGAGVIAVIDGGGSGQGSFGNYTDATKTWEAKLEIKVGGIRWSTQEHSNLWTVGANRNFSNQTWSYVKFYFTRN